MMKSKTLIAMLALAASLSLATTASADTTRDQMEQQGNQHVEQLWNEYQQAMRDRQNIWEQTQGDRFSDAYIQADAHAGAALQEYERAKTQLGDQLHNYDVDQAQQGSEINGQVSSGTQTGNNQWTSAKAESVSASTTEHNRPNDRLNYRFKNNSGSTKSAETGVQNGRRIKYLGQGESGHATVSEMKSSYASGNLSIQHQNTVQAKPVAFNQGRLPQTGNAVSWLAPLIGMFGLGLAVKEVKRNE